MSSDSFYRPPASSLETSAEAGASGSVESALVGNYDLPFGDIFSEAWTLTHGSKGVIWSAGAIYIAFTFASQILSTMLLSNADVGMGMRASLVTGVASTTLNLLLYPLSIGMLLFAVRRAAHDSDSGFTDITGCYSRLVPLILLQALSTILTALGMLLLILPGIYLTFAFFFGGLLVAERGLGVWDALETSRKALTTHWFQFVGFSLLISVAVILGGVLSLGVGFIWLLPWALLCYGVAYRRIFGTAAPTL